MNLSRRTKLIMTGAALTVIGITALVSYWVLAIQAATLERRCLESHGRALASLIQDGLEDVGKATRDYAQWDDTLIYQRQGSEKYASATFLPTVFDNLSIRQMLFLDNAGRIHEGFTNMRSAGVVTHLADADARRFMETYSKTIRSHITQREELIGIFMVEGQPSLMSIIPVSNTAGTVFDGALAFSRPLDEAIRIRMMKAIGGDVIYGKPETGNDFQPFVNEPFFQATMGAFNTSEKYTSAKLNLTDILGEPVMGITLGGASEIWTISRQFLTMLVGVTFVSVFVIMLFQTWINNLLILRPIRKLGEFLNTITDYSKLREYPIYSEHALLLEDSSVIGQIHSFLRRISEDTIKLQRDRLSTRLALDSSMAGIWEYDKKSGMIHIDAQIIRLLNMGLTSAAISRDVLHEHIHPEHWEALIQLLREHGSEGDIGFQLECQIWNKAGDYHWFLIKGNGLEWDDKGQCVLFSGILLDIDQNKQLQSELMHLSYHDKLTGLYNRRYFEEHLAHFDKPENMPIAIFVADINGLKLANDAFGHERGDGLLKQAAGCLQTAAGPQAVISRWGGDEYAILLPRTDEKQAENLFRRIKEGCQAESLHALSLHLALGYSVKAGGSISLNHVVRSAEEGMYRDKLLESRKAHADFLDKFKEQLNEKGIETHEHCRRVAVLGSAIGKRMDLNRSLLEDIVLLGDLHDIGKIAMPEALFNKAEELTEMEWALVHSHPEVGFRIVALMQDYAHLAQAVLSHHEWYDGSGYPRGLKGTDIPLIVRIVTVADAVDAMLTDQLYRPRMDAEAVIDELQRNKGVQFDPEIAGYMIAILTEDPTVNGLFMP